MKANKAIFLAIVIISAFLRVFMLSSIPNGFFSDEASSGYDAYSILLTGNDRHWNFMPLLFRSFDDYKPALYAYLVMPSISVLGLNVTAVRLPSAIFGILTVLAVFFLILGIVFMLVDYMPLGILFLSIFAIFVFNYGEGNILELFIDPVIFIVFIII